MRLQAGLGKVSPNNRGDLDNFGKLTLARVVKYNNRDATVDVALINGTYVGEGSGTNDTVRCLKLTNYAGFNADSNASYGNASPLRTGDIVVVAYLESDKHKPIIIGSLPNIDYTLTNHPELKADGEFEEDKDEIFSVNHLQDFSYTNGQGEFEKVHHTGVFFVGKEEKMSDHRENAFNFEDLSIKNKRSYKTIRNEEIKENFKPFNFLFTTRDSYDEKDENTVFNRFYHDAELGVTRFSRDTYNQLFYMEIDKGFRIQFNRNSNRRPKNENEQDIYMHKTLRKSDHDFIYPKLPKEDIPEFQQVEDFTRFEIDENGDISLKIQDKGTQTEVSISDAGVNVLSTRPINIHSKSSISIMAPSVSIVEASPSFNIREVDKEHEWKRQWIDPFSENGANV